MAENTSGISDVVQKGMQTANTVRGAVKTGKAIAAAAKGGAAGGWIGAVAAFAWENRRLVAAIIVGLIVILLIPVVIVSMLPTLIFGGTNNAYSPTDADNPEKYKEMPILGVLYNILIASQSTKRLANILNRLVNGSASTFNQQTNVDLNNKYTVLDISELSGDLLPVGMFVALDFVWDKAKENRTIEKAIYVDEMWQLIGSTGNRVAAEFVLEMFKIIRGYGGSAICGTQDLNDFFALEDGKYGKGIINVCKTKIILNLEDDEAQRVKDIFKLSEAEIMEITHFERGNGLISTNNNNITVEFKCSELEKSLITTDRRELQKILENKKGVIQT